MTALDEPLTVTGRVDSRGAIVIVIRPEQRAPVVTANVHTAVDRARIVDWVRSRPQLELLVELAEIFEIAPDLDLRALPQVLQAE